MLHPSLLTAIQRPKHVQSVDWPHDFVRKCKSLDSGAIDAAHFSAVVQKIPHSKTDGTQPLTVLNPQLACAFNGRSALIEEDTRPNFDQRVRVLPTESAPNPDSAFHSPSSGSKASLSSPTLQSPYRSSPGSRTSQLRSMRSNSRHHFDDENASTDSPTKYLDEVENAPSTSSATNALKAISRLQRHLESDGDGVVLGQLW
jgi:hypothetical protein